MGWPPRVGELLPRAEEAVGVRYKLATYSLNTDHAIGGPKARGFAQILGITIDSIDYLAAAIYAGILTAPISAVRNNSPHGVNCVVEFPLQGLGAYGSRVAKLRTVWAFANADSQPRLVSALLKP